MVTTVAPTIPVDAASSAPTAITEIPRPPRSPPKSRPMASSNSSATFERSSITPMKTKSGTAIRTSFHIALPKMRCGMARMKLMSKTPNAYEKSPNSAATPESVKATGNPARRQARVVTNMTMTRISPTSMAGQAASPPGSAVASWRD